MVRRGVVQSVVCVCLLAGIVHPAPSRARTIPGINGSDPFPGSCVSCHVKRADMDARLGARMKVWMQKADPKLVAKAQRAMPPGVTLKGKHPAALGAMRNVPASCKVCHTATSKIAPNFPRMMHEIHLTGGAENRFLTQFGECTACHKFEAATGRWSIPNRPEK